MSKEATSEKPKKPSSPRGKEFFEMIVLVLINLLLVAAVTFTVFIGAKMPERHIEEKEVRERVERAESNETVKEEAIYRARLADETRDKLVKRTWTFRFLSIFVVVVLLADAWYIFLFWQRLRKTQHAVKKLAS